MNMESASGSPVSSLSKTPESEEDLISFADEVFEYCQSDRSGFDYRIKEALHMLAGDHWIRYVPHTQQFARHSLDDWIPTPTTNYLVKYFDRIVDLFVSGDLAEIVDPATKDQADIEAALAAQRALRAEFSRMHTETGLIIPAAGWLTLTGNAAVSAVWNARAGRQVKSPRMSLKDRPVEQDILECNQCGYKEDADLKAIECPECGSDMVPGKVSALDMQTGKPMMESYREHEVDEQGNKLFDEFTVGDIEERCVNLLNWFPQPTKSWEHCRYVVEGEPIDLDELRDIFGSKAAEVHAEDLEVSEWTGVFNTAIQTMAGLDDEKAKRDHCYLRFLRHVPCKKWKDGLLLITANGRVMHKGKLDHCGDGKLPYEFMKYRDIPGFFWGQGVFQDVIPMMKRVNAIDSHIVQNRKQMVSAQWLVPEGSAISHIDGRSGLIIRWSPSTTAGFKPEKMPGTPVSQQVLNEREQTISDMEEVSGAREILQGDVPPGPETGAAIERMQEQAFRRFKPAISRFRQGLANHAHRKLRLIQKHWAEPRLIRTIGENKETQSFYLSGADLRRAEDMEIRVSIGLDFSEASKRDRVVNALSSGLLGDPNDPVVRGKVLEKLQIEGFESEYVLDAKKARRALLAIQNGEDPPEILPVDNHGVQFQIFREHMLTTEFEESPDSIKEKILARAVEHQQALQSEQENVMAAAQATKGAGDAATAAVAESGAMGGDMPTTA
jgi:hypothetical protein